MHLLFLTLYELSLSSERAVRSSLSKAYITMKFLECVNVIGQLCAINWLLNTDYVFWGLGILLDMLKGRQWQESGHFPRVSERAWKIERVLSPFGVLSPRLSQVAYCDLSVREMGNINDWTVQCVLMVSERVCERRRVLSQSDTLSLVLGEHVQREDLHLPVVLVRLRVYLLSLLFRYVGLPSLL